MVEKKRSVGRPTKENNFQRTIYGRISDEQFNKFEQISNKNRRSVSNMLRVVIEDFIKENEAQDK